jgi:type I restriction enzyme S subunit
MLSAKARSGNGGRPYLRNKNVQWGRIHIDDLLTMDFSTEEFEKFRLREGDLLVCEGGEVGRAAIWKAPLAECAYQKALHRVRPRGGVVPEYLLYLLMHYADTRAFDRHVTGSTIAHLPQEDLRRLPLPLPPLAEQQRIVAAIEEHLSRLEAAEEWLSSVPERLKAARRSALSQVIQADGCPIVPLKDVGDGSRYALAIGPFGSNLKVSDYRDSGVPLVFVRNIRARQFGGPGTRFVSVDKANELAPHWIRGGDVLITKMGDPPGDTTVYPKSAPDAIITADCIKISVGASFDPEFVALAIEAPEQHQQVLAATKGVAQKKVSLGRFREMTIPAPPLDEQQEIAHGLGELFSKLDSQGAAVNLARRRSGALRRAVLAAVFRGELVPQDPRDEPASVLLERIAAERAAVPKATRTRKAKASA